MTWGTKIILAFGCFITLIISMVVISMRQNINLVAPDYYTQEIAYQDQIDRIKNHKNAKKLTLEHDKKSNSVILSHSGTDSISGDILFFRPSDAKKDVRYNIVLSHNQQVFDMRKMSPGLWKVKVSWKQNEQEFYEEKTIVL